MKSNPKNKSWNKVDEGIQNRRDFLVNSGKSMVAVTLPFVPVLAKAASTVVSLGGTASSFDISPDSFTTAQFLTAGAANNSFTLTKQALGHSGILVGAFASYNASVQFYSIDNSGDSTGLLGTTSMTSLSGISAFQMQNGGSLDWPLTGNHNGNSNNDYSYRIGPGSSTQLYFYNGFFNSPSYINYSTGIQYIKQRDDSYDANSYRKQLRVDSQGLTLGGQGFFNTLDDSQGGYFYRLDYHTAVMDNDNPTLVYASLGGILTSTDAQSWTRRTTSSYIGTGRNQLRGVLSSGKKLLASCKLDKNLTNIPLQITNITDGYTQGDYTITSAHLPSSSWLSGTAPLYVMLLSRGNRFTFYDDFLVFLEVHSTKIQTHFVKINSSGVVSGKTITCATPTNSSTYGSSTQACIHPNGKTLYITEHQGSSTTVRKIQFDKVFFFGN